MEDSRVNNTLSVEYVESKLEDFLSDLNSNIRISMLSFNQADKERMKYLFVKLKISVKDTLRELQVHNRENYEFLCGLCDKKIFIELGNANVWDSLQTHEHFEQLYVDFLTARLQLDSESDMAMASDSNTDSSIEQPEKEPSGNASGTLSTSVQGSSSSRLDKADVNNFRFNFPLEKNHSEIKNKIYPSNLMTYVRSYDRVQDFTIQRAGPMRASCLICPCEMNGIRVSKFILANHAMGQKHMKAASNPEVLKILQNFHLSWLKEETNIQAHQVFFRPKTFNHLTCLLCHNSLEGKDLKAHIKGDKHKKNVLDLVEKNNPNYLANLQIEVYGITQEKVQLNGKEARPGRRFIPTRRKSTKPLELDTREDSPEPEVHNIIKAVNDMSSVDLLKLLPNRMKNDLQFLEMVIKGKQSSINCRLCDCTIPEDLRALMAHLAASILHIQQRNQKYTYFCEICNVRINSEQSWIQHDFGGPRHKSMAESRKLRVTEYECTTCNAVIFGDELSLTRHVAGTRKRGKKEAKRLPVGVMALFKSKQAILSEADRLVAETEELVALNSMRECCADLERSLNEVFEQCKVYPFGSRISGIGNKDSDLDVFVDVGDMYLGLQLQDPPDQVQLIRRAAKAFRNMKVYTELVQITTARTPILRLYHKPTEIACDLSFRHGLSVENTKFLRLCLELQPVVKQCILLLKRWVGFIGFEKVITYAFALMAIFYLQTNHYLPSVATVRKMSKGEPLVIGGWKTISNCPPVGEIRGCVKTYPDTVDVLLKEFFAYYGKFDFNNYVVCPLVGYTVQKSKFMEDNGRQLPAEMEPYLQQLENAEYELFRANAFMCIQDPFDLSHNLTKAAQRGTVQKFQTMCALTLKFLEGGNA
ncbi:speckle targeted PIP5K1A-regulated poly(A) polymerase-like [Cylas formicarius]|uniref:speckle targeted PIP5K1A-regulated poly(A) polymerase-like n=1 Tax=Cylas formicarius TaxID=197179 RepID=UPI0029585789|nr:speckle targeted PIP5K1A-regulated poly(A) polymerase-like [Cylas formicarius]